MTNFFDNRQLIDIIWKWKKHLIIVGVIAIVASFVFSSSVFIKPKFRSTARIYPSFNIYTYSEESESEQVLEFINSQDIKFRVIDAFKLDEVYKINKSDPFYQSYILAKFNDNVTFKKTEYETVEIRVLDTDPNRACAMCDSIISFLDQKINNLHRVKYTEMLNITKKALKNVDHELDSIKSKMDGIRRDYNILDYKTQAREVTRGMVNVLTEQKMNTAGGKELREWMRNLSEKGGEYDQLSELEKTCVSQRDSIKRLYNQSIDNVQKFISFGQKVQSPVPADKKAYPVRWLIVLVSTLAALFVAVLTVLVLENKKKA